MDSHALSRVTRAEMRIQPVNLRTEDAVLAGQFIDRLLNCQKPLEPSARRKPAVIIDADVPVVPAPGTLIKHLIVGNVLPGVETMLPKVGAPVSQLRVNSPVGPQKDIHRLSA